MRLDKRHIGAPPSREHVVGCAEWRRKEDKTRTVEEHFVRRDTTERCYPSIWRVGWIKPSLGDQIRLDLTGDQQQRRLTVPRQTRFDQFAAVLDAQLEPEVVLQ